MEVSVAQVLAELQDRLQSFPSSIAMQLIEEELGQPVGALYSQLSPEPVAAASLGQVRARSGCDTAVAGLLGLPLRVSPQPGDAHLVRLFLQYGACRQLQQRAAHA